jgi:hypothetical protein
LYDEYLSAFGARGFGLSNLMFEVRIYTGTPASPCVLLTAQWEVRDIFHVYYSTGVLLMLSSDRVIFWGNLGDFFIGGREWNGLLCRPYELGIEAVVVMGRL